MIDELEELRRSNPTSPEALVKAVAIDRQELMDALAADSDEQQPRLRILGGRSRRSATRVGYVGAMVAAAAAFIGIVVIGGEDPPGDLDAVEVEVADENSGPAPLVIESPDEERSSDAPTADGATSTTTGIVPSEGAEQDGSATESDGDGPAVTTPEQTTSSVTNPDEGPPSPPIEGPFDSSIDLLVLHYDHAHLDDGHAAVAALEIATSFGLQPLVVAGTYPSGYEGHVNDFEPVMRAAWGDRWVDAHVDRLGALTSSADRWLATVDAGGRVWVAEGGVSDFTADVVREIQRQRPDLDTRTAVHVVQHSDRNETQSAPESISFLKANVDYERIADGNGTNDTANLNMESGEFEAAALTGQHASSWSAAFEYLPADNLDFSDTVEVLHILGVGIDEVADPDDFANRFMG